MATEQMGLAPFRAISADSHVTEPPNCYIDNIEARYRATAPRVVRDSARGEVFVIHGMDESVPIGLVAAAGRDPKTIKLPELSFAGMHPGGWDPKARLGEQDVDGVVAEVLYPTIGMVLCSHPDPDYRQATMRAYNRWLEGYVAAAPDRLIGIGQTAARTVAEAVEDAHVAKAMGFRGLMLPNEPGTSVDYDHASFDALWEACVGLGLPISFHTLTSRSKRNTISFDSQAVRGPAITQWYSVIRAVQDVIGMFVFSGVFDRHPDLMMVCAEGDAGWAPHYMFRMDHAYKRMSHWKGAATLSRAPSEYFKANVRLTFQDDAVAFAVSHMCDPRQFMWANDFPHSDATWPHSADVVGEQAAHLAFADKKRILRDNVAELYGIE